MHVLEVQLHQGDLGRSPSRLNVDSDFLVNLGSSYKAQGISQSEDAARQGMRCENCFQECRQGLSTPMHLLQQSAGLECLCQTQRPCLSRAMQIFLDM